jgi:hypothetical protein
MKLKLLAAVASIALISAGVATYAQDNMRHDQQPGAGQTQQRPEAAPRAPPANGQGQMNGEAPKAAQTERRETPQQGEARPEKAAPRQADTREENRDKAMRPAANEPRGNDRDRRQGAKGVDRPPRVTGNLKISNEHAERVSETLRRGGRPERVNFDVRVGARVPGTVSLRLLPLEVISLVPEYRGYDYFIDSNDEIVFVSPGTHEIVGTIDYEANDASEGVISAQGVRPCPVGAD